MSDQDPMASPPDGPAPVGDDLAAFPQDYGSLSLRRKTGQEARRRLNRPVYRIGREIGNDLTLPDPGISRYHARILCTLEGCLIEDLGSQNGTFLNNERLPANQPKPLIEGDSIRIGEYVLVYHLPEPMAQPTDEEFVLTFAEPSRPALPSTITAWPLPPRSNYLQHLPSFFSQDSLTDRFLLIFESVLAPIEQLIDHLALVLDPRTQPADLLPWLASWLDLTLNENWPEERRRSLIRSASELYRWRGTRHGLSRYLEIYAGVTPEIDDELDQPHTFRVTLRVPADEPLDEALVRDIVEHEKPAHTFYELRIEPAKPMTPPPVPPEPVKERKPATGKPAPGAAEPAPAGPGAPPAGAAPASKRGAAKEAPTASKAPPAGKPDRGADSGAPADNTPSEGTQAEAVGSNPSP